MLKEIVPHLKIDENWDIEIKKAGRWDSAEKSSIIWFDKRTMFEEVLEKIAQTEARYILHSHREIKNIPDKILIYSKHPRIDFIKICKFLDNLMPGIHPSATIINTIFKGEAHIEAGARIGNEGFGFEKDDNHQWTRFPHFGKVIIHNNVYIGANTCIDRGTLGDTVIGTGTKIDNLVHIAHNVVIGCNCLIIAQSMIGGSATIGDNVYIAPGCVIRDHINIGNNSFIGMGSLVTKDIPEGQVWMGSPAKFCYMREELDG